MGNACSKKPSVDKEAHQPTKSPSEDFRTPNPYDDRATAYNPEVQHREELIRLHESARRKENIQGTPWDTSSNPFADAAATDNHRGTMKRMPISATPLNMSETLSFRYSVIPKSPEEAKFLLEALGDNFVFDVLDDKTKRRLVDVMVVESFEEGEWVMHQGETGDYFYIVAEGSVAYHVEPDLAPDTISSTSQGILPTSSPVGTGAKGSTFGELALIYNQARSSSVLATTPLKLYKIDQLTFRSFVMSNKVHHRDDIMALLKDVSIFDDLVDDQLSKLADAFTLVDFEEGERIVNKGECGSILYIVKSGEIKLHDIGHGLSKFEDQILKEGGYFGERALFEDETRGRAANVTAVTESSLLAISKKSFEEITGPIEQATMSNSRSKFLRSVPLMRQLEIDEINRCVKFLKEEQFKKDDSICTNGKLYLIQDGEALMVLHDVITGGKEGESTLVRLKKGDYFGSIWEYDKEKDEMDQNTVNAETDLTCLTLRTTDVENVIGDMIRISVDVEEESLDLDRDESAKKYHQMNERKIENMAEKRVPRQMGSFSIIKSQRFKPTHDKMKLRDLTKVRMLGVGTFGKVWLVTPHDKPKNGSKPKSYALKMISKRQLLQAKLVAAVLREKNVMESIQHPFLLNMVESFQDKDYLYLMLNLVLGGELFDLLYGKDKERKVPFANKEWAKSTFYQSFGTEGNVAPVEGQGVGVRAAVFYSACVIEAFSHLYNRKIVYRDLKPENVMINSKGYCVVVDMGFAKVVRDKTYTMCGTPEYLSPEVILNMGHNHAADHWSFGCLLYELIVGRTPFYNKNSMDQINLMKRIVKADYRYPEFCSGLNPRSQGLDKVLYDWKVLTFRLLSNNSTERLGNLSGGIEDIIGHGWFGNIDFNELRGQKLPAPWVPDVKDPLDPSSETNGGPACPENRDFFATELSVDDQEAFKAFS